MSGVRWSVADGVARITLSRPEVSNAVDLTTAREFGKAVEAASDEAVRVVVVQADGPRFCAGGDVRSMVASTDRSDYLLALATALGDELERLGNLTKPVVTGVHGAVAGAGLAFVLHSDVTIAARSTKFVMAYSSIGLTPDCGVSYLLPRAIGQQRALELALTNRALSAETAQEWGLVTEVVDDDAVPARVDEIAARLARLPAFALGQTRRLIRESWTTTPSASLRDESETIARAVVSPEAAALLEQFGT